MEQQFVVLLVLCTLRLNTVYRKMPSKPEDSAGEVGEGALTQNFPKIQDGGQTLSPSSLSRKRCSELEQNFIQSINQLLFYFLSEKEETGLKAKEA